MNRKFNWESLRRAMHNSTIPTNAQTLLWDATPILDSQTTKPNGQLYLGSLYACNDREACNKRGITSVVSLLAADHFKIIDKTESPHEKKTTYRIPIYDSSAADIYRHFAKASRHIRSQLQQGHNTLVHCQAGISRSATLVIAFLMSEHFVTYEIAFEHVKQLRPINPNPGFTQQLRRWERQMIPIHIRRQKRQAFLALQSLLPNPICRIISGYLSYRSST